MTVVETREAEHRELVSASLARSQYERVVRKICELEHWPIELTADQRAQLEMLRKWRDDLENKLDL